MNSIDISFLKSEISDHLEKDYEVVVYGSQVSGGARPTSDIDLALISRSDNEDENIKIQKKLFGVLPNQYDFRVFELLPIYVQISIIEEYVVIQGDPLEISEYFYKFRKVWNDCKHRILDNQFSNFEEMLTARKHSNL